jgi:hypothetical protein
MVFLIVLLTLVLVAVVVLVVGAPLRNARRAGASPLAAAEASGSSSMSLGQMQSLEAAREAKYREIRDAELDFRTGKLSREDYDAIDADLRSEALGILNRLQPAQDEASGAEVSGPGALEQQERVEEEQHAEEDRPAV